MCHDGGSVARGLSLRRSCMSMSKHPLDMPLLRLNSRSSRHACISVTSDVIRCRAPGMSAITCTAGESCAVHSTSVQAASCGTHASSCKRTRE